MKTLGSKAYIYFNKFEINQIHNLVENYKTHTKVGLNKYIYIYIYTKFPKYVPYYQKKIKRPTNSSRLTHHPSPK